MSQTISPSHVPAIAPSEKTWSYMDTVLSVVVNATLVLAVSMGLFMLLAAPGQPLDFLMAGGCGAAL